MKLTETTRCRAALAAGAMVVLAACGGDSQPPSQPQAEERAVEADTSGCAPVRIALILDQTGSIKQTRTQQGTLDDMALIFELLRTHGGECGVTFIRDQSNRSLVRMRVETPPEEPAAPAKDRNPLKNSETQVAYDRRLADFQVKLRRWRTGTDAEIEVFRDKLEPLLAQGLAGKTDVLNALRRADLFLAEPAAGWSKAHLWLVAMSDGLDNVGAPPVALASGANAVVVNGSASLGVLESLNALRYESLQAALRKVVEAVGTDCTVAQAGSVTESR